MFTMNQGETENENILLFGKDIMLNSSQPFMIGYPDGRIVMVNAALNDILGYEKDELLNIKWNKGLTVHEFQAKELQAVEKLIYSQKPQSYEIVYQCKNGRLLQVEIQIHGIFSDAGKPGYFYFFINNISKRKEIEKELYKSEMRSREQVNYFNYLLNNMNSLFYTYDMDCRITFINSKAIGILGYEPGDLIGRFIWEFIPERYREKFMEEIKERLHKGQQNVYQLRILHKNGTERIFKLNASPIIKEGFITGEMAIARDITDHIINDKVLKDSNESLIKIREELIAANQQLKATEEELMQQLDESEKNKEALANAHQQLESVIDFLPDPTFVINDQGIITMWNRAMEELTGVKAREMLGKGNRQYSIPFYGKREPVLIDQVLKYQENEEQELFDNKGESETLFEEIFYPQIGTRGAFLSCKSSPLYNRDASLVGAIETMRDVSERKKSERALRESEEKYRNIIESIEDGYFEVDLKGYFQFVNSYLLKTVGYTMDDFMGENYKIVMDEANSQIVHNAFNRVYTSGKSIKEFGWTVLCRDGKKLDVETTILPKKDGESVVGFRGIVHDISERKQAEEALKKSENLYRTIFETTGTATIIIDSDMTISLVNSKMEQLTGYTREEMEGKRKWTEVIHPEDLEKMKKFHIMRRHNPAHAPRNYEFRLLTKNGDTRDIVLTIAMIPGSNQSVTSLLDITERKRAEKALQISEARYRAIVEDQTELICRVVADSSNLTFVNEAYCRYFNKKREEILNKPVALKSYYEEEDRELLISQIQSLSKDNPVITVEHRLRMPDGEIRWQQWTHRALFNENGILVDYQSVGRDITEQKLAEEKLKYLSLHDPLTGLFNRFYFEEQMLLMEKEYKKPIGLVMCDVDGLKLINDTLGHDKGDDLLKTVAAVLRHCFRKSDIIARVGGDEFAVLLPDVSKDIVKEIFQKIRNTINYYNGKKNEFHLSISMGYAIRESQATGMTEIFKEADNNMYREKLHSGHNLRSSIMETLIGALEIRDFITEGHDERIKKYVEKMASTLGLTERAITNLQLLAQFHDIGKVGISDSILFKPGPLTREEYVIMQRHCEIGHRIARSAPDLVLIADWILKHHEWWNGNGYPLGLSGEDIPVECRIFSIADAYDAITNDRPYRKARSHEEAIQELKRYAGIQFDPCMVDIFIEILEKQ